MKKLLILLIFSSVAFFASSQNTITTDHIRARSSFRIGAASGVAATGIRDTMPATPGKQLITADGIADYVAGEIALIPGGVTYTAGSGISISGGNVISATDASASNELQTLSILGSSLTLSNGGGTIIVPGGTDSTWQKQPSGFTGKLPSTPITRTGQLKIENNRIILDKVNQDSINNALNQRGSAAISIRTVDKPQNGQTAGTILEAQLHTNTLLAVKPVWKMIYSADTLQNLGATPPDVIGNYVVAQGWNLNDGGSLLDTNFASLSQNMEFNYRLNLGPDRVTEYHLNHNYKGVGNGGVRVISGAFTHSKNPDAATPRIQIGFNTDLFYIKGQAQESKWSYNFGPRSTQNVVTASDTAVINFETAGHYGLTQLGTGLMRNNTDGYLDLGGDALSIELAGSTVVRKAGGGFLFGNSTYPAVNGMLLTQGAAGLDGYKMQRVGEADIWNIRKDANNLVFENSSGTTTQVTFSRLAPTNSLTVAATTGNVGVGTASAPYKLYVNGTSGTVGIGATAVGNDGTNASVAFYATGTATGSNYAYGFQSAMSAPNNAILYEFVNNSATSSSAQTRLNLVTQHASADVFIDFLGGGGGTARWTLGVANSATGNPIRLTNSQGNLGGNVRLQIESNGATGIGGAPAASAMLDVSSTTQGLLFPRMTEAQRDAIGSPADGLVIYNTTAGKLQVRAASAWSDLH